MGIIGTGDEIVEPGKPLAEGKLYASNIMTLAGWCNKYKMKTRMTIVKDDHDAIFSALKMLSDETDAVITSGGAWTGDRDMVAQVLEGLGWEEVFHRIRIGPGKAVGFGILDKTPSCRGPQPMRHTSEPSRKAFHVPRGISRNSPSGGTPSVSPLG